MKDPYDHWQLSCISLHFSSLTTWSIKCHQTLTNIGCIWSVDCYPELLHKELTIFCQHVCERRSLPSASSPSLGNVSSVSSLRVSTTQFRQYISIIPHAVCCHQLVSMIPLLCVQLLGAIVCKMSKCIRSRLFSLFRDSLLSECANSFFSNVVAAVLFFQPLVPQISNSVYQ
jgi:hypothetical protein